MAKTAKQKRLPLYGTYVFKGDEKDPCIDVVHTAIDDTGLNYNQISELSGVSRNTIYQWIEGDTRKPQFCTIAAVMGACGLEMSWVKKKRSNNVVPLNQRKVA